MSDPAMTLDDMARLHRACFAHLRPWPAAEIAEILASAHSFAITRAQGFLIGRAVAGEAEIITLAVDPAARRKGIGRDLVQDFMSKARRMEAQRAFLEVAADNTAAITLYSTCGFTQTGLRRAYYRTPDGTAIDGLIMGCPV
ncbi:MAG: ribosomal protein S18-alanine N-acetyltransferase [Cypionkella sp.]|nr:ribosomal protein S18-alanine N-acetyltransferase [Cypionkella sp.]